MVESRKAKESHEKIPENVHMVKDGEAIRVLGAWVGNKIDNEGIWAPTNLRNF